MTERTRITDCELSDALWAAARRLQGLNDCLLGMIARDDPDLEGTEQLAFHAMKAAKGLAETFDKEREERREGQ